jgi:hypothetical protein
MLQHIKQQLKKNPLLLLILLQVVVQLAQLLTTLEEKTLIYLTLKL